MTGEGALASGASLVQRLAPLKVVPVVEISRAEQAVELADVLAEAGLPVLEITLRTPAAIAAIEAIALQRPNVLVGAGTILDRAGLEAAVAAGAAFGVSPGFDPQLSRAAREAALDYLPGTATATEVQAALAAGHRVVKFFPAQAAGGLAAVRALGAAFGVAGVRFVPTGGIRATNAADYLGEACVLAVGGTWIAPRHEIESGAWEAILGRARAARHLADAVQSADAAAP